MRINKLLNIAVVFILVIISVVAAVRIVKLNKKYPNPKIEGYNFGEKIIYDGFEINSLSCKKNYSS